MLANGVLHRHQAPAGRVAQATQARPRPAGGIPCERLRGARGARARGRAGRARTDRIHGVRVKGTGMSAIRVGVVAPSSAVGRVELANGVARLRAAGLDVTVHSQCARLHYTFAGTDDERAAALFAYAVDPAID